MTIIGQRVLATRERITQLELHYQRGAGSVQLLAVSKTRTVKDILDAVAVGQIRFGESYVQEALPKIKQLAQQATGHDLEWHFIGPLQSNKTRGIAENFSWLHSLDRLSLARRLNDQRPENMPPLNVCLQINISAEPGKSGTTPESVFELAEAVNSFPRLQLRGLMTVPSQQDNLQRQREAFYQLHELYSRLNTSGHALDTLSMGMTEDMEAAIAEGATFVRIGTGIFGPRKKSGTSDE